MWRTVILGAGALLALTRTLPAQGSAVPVVVTVSVTTEDGRLFQPVRFVLVFRPERTAYPDDYFATQTDGAGRAEVMLRPGQYRVRSAAPLRLTSVEYSWDLLHTVDATSGRELQLTEANARRTPPLRPGQTVVVTPDPSVPPPQPPVQERPDSQGAEQPPRRTELQYGDPGYKEPGTARLLSLLPGVGHLYTGETLKGLGFLVGEAGLVAAGIALLADCEESVEDCDTKNALAAGSFAGAFGIALYSFLDAGPSARRSNVRNARLQVSVHPAGMRVGLRYSF